MSRPKETIDSYMEAALFKLISQSISKMPPEEADNAFKKLKSFDHYNRYDATHRKRITIDALTSLLQIAGVSIVDLYAAVGISVYWPNESSKEFHSMLTKHTDSEKLKILRIIEDLSPQFWRTTTPELSTPTKRMLYVIEHKYSRSNNIRAGVLDYLGSEVQQAWKDHKQFTTVSFSSLPLIAEKLQISLHWLLGLGNKATVLAGDSISENCITGYLFLDNYGQATIDMLMEDLESR